MSFVTPKFERVIARVDIWFARRSKGALRSPRGALLAPIIHRIGERLSKDERFALEHYIFTKNPVEKIQQGANANSEVVN